MKILKSLTLDKYHDAEKYASVDGVIFEDLSKPTYCVTLYCELEEGEDTQYPLEDILDKYYVNCTDVMEEKEEDGKRIYVVEIEGSLRDKEENLKDVQQVAALIGKRTYNYQEGAYIKLGIE